MTANDPIIKPTTATGSGGGMAAASSATMLNQPIVIDCGSAAMKAGFAGGTKPKVRRGTMTIVLYLLGSHR